MASTQVLWPLTAAAWLWANSLTGQTSTGSTAADRIAFTRLNTYALEVGEPGVAVVRDSAAWWTLWQYFGHEYRSQWDAPLPDRKSTRLNSSHDQISYAVFCLKKKKKKEIKQIDSHT